MDLSIRSGLRLRHHPTCFTDKITWDYAANLARDDTNDLEDRIAQLEALQRRFVGDYTINTLADLEVFRFYTSITGSLSIEYSNLTTLEGLESLTQIGGYLLISDNAALTSLDGLDNITSVGGYLLIGGNAALTSLDGLDNITSVGGYLQIVSNAALTSLDGLDNITSVGGFLSINSNDTLTNLDGLDNITSVGGYLLISDNAALTNLDGLDNITSVGGLSIDGNAALTSLNLDSLNFVDLNFIINYNIELCTSLAEALKVQVLAGGGIGGSIIISDNKDCP